MDYDIPNFELNVDLEESLQNIEKVIEDLNQRRDKGLDNDLDSKLKKQLLISQVYNSNAIEGNKLSLRETELILDKMVVNERPLKDEIEAQSLANATEYLYSLIDGSEPLTRRTLLELHGLIMENIPNIPAGAFRRDEVTIKNSEHNPPSFLTVDSHIEHLFKWMNRNAHKYSPLIMASILHHWLTWIHPFSDGNGRVSRLFLNFFLLQKGYPEVIIKITNRDNYYNSLIEADKGNIGRLIELIVDSIRETVSIYEEFINESERQIAWKNSYKKLLKTSEDEPKDISVDFYHKAKETYAFQYEVWKNQISVFRALLKENIRDIEGYIPNVKFSIKEYEMLSFSQYLDILEDRKVTNTWYLSLNLEDESTGNKVGFIFYFERFKFSKAMSILGQSDDKKGRRLTRESKPQIKLYVSARVNQKSQQLDSKIELINIGTWGDQLSFGVHNKDWKPTKQYKKAKIITVKENPGKVVRRFIDQILECYFNLCKKK
jgi:Fic family protein